LSSCCFALDLRDPVQSGTPLSAYPSVCIPPAVLAIILLPFPFLLPPLLTLFSRCPPSQPYPDDCTATTTTWGIESFVIWSIYHRCLRSKQRGATCNRRSPWIREHTLKCVAETKTLAYIPLTAIKRLPPLSTALPNTPFFFRERNTFNSDGVVCTGRPDRSP